ncbi:hypothetical protein EV199_3463 [Pseudobacter ginsenosidimutans]|uniref:Uncharacterized protein n=1 Tax=Pseudobacter ginsenosidimutans TaxID=661488 RepID=A0A4Q7MSV1_9BACT|nr:hypothetical protein EV199_3463 [Pseudobacter ginsenosidimutans]
MESRPGTRLTGFRVFKKNICYNNNCELFLAPHAKHYEVYKAYEEASQ